MQCASEGVSIEEAGQSVGYGGGGSSNGDGLDGAAEPSSTYELSFERAEEGKSDEGDDNRELEGSKVVAYQHVGEQRNDSSDDVRTGDGKGRAVGAVCGRLFEAKLEAHHEVDPLRGVLFERGEDRCGGGAFDRILLEDLVDLFLFVLGTLDDLAFFAMTFGDVVLGISAGGEVAAEAHGDRSGSDLGEAGEDDDVGRGDRSRQTRRKGEGDGEAVGESDDDIANGGAGLEVAFYVLAAGILGDLMHGRSVVQRSGLAAG